MRPFLMTLALLSFLLLLFSTSAIRLYHDVTLLESFPVLPLFCLFISVFFAAIGEKKWLSKRSLLERSLFFFGCIFPIAPVLGVDIVSILSLLIFGGVICKNKETFPHFGFPILLYLILYGGFTLVHELPNLQWSINAAQSVQFLGIQGLSQLGFAALLFSAFAFFKLCSEEKSAQIASVRGILWGGTLGLLFSIIQALTRKLPLIEQIHLQFPRQTPLWDSLNRSVGTFTDPNAFGIFSAVFFIFLLLHIGKEQDVYNERPRLVLCGMILAILGGLLSGSRTFLLYILVFFVLYGALTAYSVRKQPNGRGVLVILIGISLCGLIVLGLDNFQSLVRVRETISALLRGDLSLVENRLQFASLGVEAFSRFPVSGVGPLQFSGYVTSLSDYLGIDIGFWTDNPNNAYIGFLAEYGLLGLLVMTLMLLYSKIGLQEGLHTKKRAFRVGLAAFASFAVILFIGPHYLFQEVMLLCALFLSLIIRLISVHRSSYLLAIFVVLAFSPALYVSTLQGEMGLYQWEKDPVSGHTYRWTQRAFSTWILCNDEEGTSQRQASIQIRNIASAAQRVSLSTEGGHLEQLLPAGANQSLKIPCPAENPYRGLNVKGYIDKPFYPNSKGDKRLLGVQILSESPKDILLARELDKEKEGT